MRKATYIGDSSKQIGRFGLVCPGQEFSLTEDEAKSVADSPEWQLETRDRGEGSFPQATEVYDLRDVPWGGTKLRQKLMRKGRQEISKIATAINLLGGKIAYNPQIIQKKEVVDAIVAHAEFEGWTELDG